MSELIPECTASVRPGYGDPDANFLDSLHSGGHYWQRRKCYGDLLPKYCIRAAAALPLSGEAEAGNAAWRPLASNPSGIAWLTGPRWLEWSGGRNAPFQWPLFQESDALENASTNPQLSDNI